MKLFQVILSADGPQERLEKALDIAFKYGGFAEAHHKAWVIDQIVRALTGCPVVEGQQGESTEYQKFVLERCAGDNEPETYDWDVGIPP